MGSAQPVLQDRSQLLLGVDDVILQSRHHVLQQPQSRLASFWRSAGGDIRHLEGKWKCGRPAVASLLEAATRVFLVAHVIHEHGHDLSDLLLQLWVGLLLEATKKLSSDLLLVRLADPGKNEVLLRPPHAHLPDENAIVPAHTFLHVSAAKHLHHPQKELVWSLLLGLLVHCLRLLSGSIVGALESLQELDDLAFFRHFCLGVFGRR
mmetsp:Transcript_124/g.228  ORF Transcript_124/g.228 Transcript_124/m.228 type:complete len:207 (-) Transcript_124:24-644(-)